MRRTFLILILGAATLAFAGQMPFCISFAGLTEEGRQALVLRTHRDFMDTLGKGLDAATVREMVENGDPFTIPRAKGEALEKHLTEFKKLLERQGWLTPEIKRRLVADLSGRRSDLEEAAERSRTAVKRVEPGYVVDLGKISFILDGTGRYVLASTLNNKELVVYDLVDKKTLPPVSFPNDIHNGVLNPVGDTYAFPMPDGQIRIMPFVNGVPQVAQARTLGSPDANYDLSRHRFRFAPGGYGLSIMANLSARLEFFRFDLKSGERKKVEFSVRDAPLVPNSTLGFVGNTGNIFVNNKGKIHRFEITAEGKALRVPGSFKAGNWRNETAWTSDGKLAVVAVADPKEPVTMLSPASGWKLVVLEAKGKTSGAGLRVEKLVLHPTEPKAVVLAATERKATLIWYDLESGNELGRLQLKPEYLTEFALSSDGERYVMKDTSGTNYHIGNIGEIEP